MSKLIDKIGTFTTVPNIVIRLWPNIGVDGMALFLYLRYRTNGQTETAFPGYDTIQKDTKLSRDRIAKAIRSLEGVGVIERKKRFGSSTIYTTKLPDSLELPESADAAISRTSRLMEQPSLVGHPDSISRTSRLPLVGHPDANKTESNKTEINKTLPAGAGATPILNERRDVLRQLEKQFSEFTGLPLPPRNTDAEKKAAAKRWWNPLWSMYLTAGRKIELTTNLMRQSVVTMRDDKLTISAPQSIEQVFTAKYGERNGGTAVARNNLEAQGYVDITGTGKR